MPRGVEPQNSTRLRHATPVVHACCRRPPATVLSRLAASLGLDGGILAGVEVKPRKSYFHESLPGEAASPSPSGSLKKLLQY